MSNVIQYVKDVGQIPFAERTFTAEDNVALSTVVYMPFEEVVSADMTAEPMRYTDASRLLFEKRGFEHKPLGLFITKENSLLMREMTRQKRFAEMRVAACRSCLDETPMIQFAAMTFLLPDQKIVVAFRGTDDTMEGWAEDLDMVRHTDGSIPSAVESLAYLREVADRFEGDIILCGHSKGGHNAVYCALNADESIRDRIVAVYNNDGPGFTDGSYLESDAFKALLKKYHHYVPQSSFFGMMLHHDDHYQIVKSSKPIGVLQHDMLTWQFEGERLKLIEKRAYESKFNHAFFQALVEILTESEIAAADEAARILIEHAESTRLIDAKSDVAGFVKHTADAVRSLDKDTKKAIHTVLRKSFSAAKKAIMDKP